VRVFSLSDMVSICTRQKVWLGPCLRRSVRSQQLQWIGHDVVSSVQIEPEERAQLLHPDANRGRTCNINWVPAGRYSRWLPVGWTCATTSPHLSIYLIWIRQVESLRLQPMKKTKKDQEEPAVDPERGDAILRRMLQTKPKQHKDMVAERKDARRRTRKERE